MAGVSALGGEGELMTGGGGTREVGTMPTAAIP